MAGDVHDLRCARIELALCYVRIAHDPNSINPHQIEDLSANPPVGSVITVRYQELSDGGVPRFPSYAGIRGDTAWPATPPTRPPPVAKGSSC